MESFSLISNTGMSKPDAGVVKVVHKRIGQNMPMWNFGHADLRPGGHVRVTERWVEKVAGISLCGENIPILRAPREMNVREWSEGLYESVTIRSEKILLAPYIRFDNGWKFYMNVHTAEWVEMWTTRRMSMESVVRYKAHKLKDVREIAIHGRFRGNMHRLLEDFESGECTFLTNPDGGFPHQVLIHKV